MDQAFIFNHPFVRFFKLSTSELSRNMIFEFPMEFDYSDIPKLAVHELRHTRATLWITREVDSCLAAHLLGRCDLKILTKI